MRARGAPRPGSAATAAAAGAAAADADDDDDDAAPRAASALPRGNWASFPPGSGAQSLRLTRAQAASGVISVASARAQALFSARGAEAVALVVAATGAAFEVQHKLYTSQPGHVFLHGLLPVLAALGAEEGDVLEFRRAAEGAARCAGAARVARWPRASAEGAAFHAHADAARGESPPPAAAPPPGARVGGGSAAPNGSSGAAAAAAAAGGAGGGAPRAPTAGAASREATPGAAPAARGASPAPCRREARCAATGRRFHLGCLSAADRDRAAGVCGGPFYSSPDAGVSARLLNDIARTGARLFAELDDGTQLRFLLVRGAAAAGGPLAGPAPGYDAAQRRALRRPLAAALAVLRAAYGELPDSRTGGDLLPWLLRGARLGGAAGAPPPPPGADFSGFYVAILFAGGCVVGAAACRLLAGGLAEVPLLGVRPELRGCGLGGLLRGWVERALAAARCRAALTPALAAPSAPLAAPPPGAEPPPPLQARWGYELASAETMREAAAAGALRIPGVLLAAKRLEPTGGGRGERPALPARLRWQPAAAPAAAALQAAGMVKLEADAPAAPAANGVAAPGAAAAAAAAAAPLRVRRRAPSYDSSGDEDGSGGGAGGDASESSDDWGARRRGAKRARQRAGRAGGAAAAPRAPAAPAAPLDAAQREAPPAEPAAAPAAHAAAADADAAISVLRSTPIAPPAIAAEPPAAMLAHLQEMFGAPAPPPPPPPPAPPAAPGSAGALGSPRWQTFLLSPPPAQPLRQ